MTDMKRTRIGTSVTETRAYKARGTPKQNKHKPHKRNQTITTENISPGWKWMWLFILKGYSKLLRRDNEKLKQQNTCINAYKYF